MSEQPVKFLQFPLFLIRGLFERPGETLGKMLTFGFYSYSDSLKLTNEAIAERLIYSRKTGANIRFELAQKIAPCENEGDFLKDSETRGFDSMGEFRPEELAVYLEKFEADPEFYSLAYRHAQIEMALFNLKKYFGIAFKPEIRGLEGWYMGLSIPDKEPFVKAGVKALVEFQNRDNSETSLLQFAAFMAIGSIIGKARFKITNKALIAARMLGYKTAREVEPSQWLFFDRITNRYNFERLRNGLEIGWNVRFYSAKGMRGFYVGSANELQSMADDYKNRPLKFKLKKIQEEKREATFRANGLNNTLK